MVEGYREVFVMAAYYDDRPSFALPRITFVGSANPWGVPLYWLFWHEKRSQPTLHHAQQFGIGENFYPKGPGPMGQYIFSCEIPANETRPVNVSFVTAETADHPTTLLPVQLPVKPASPSDVIEFGHCMSIMYRKEDPYQVVEWIELHRQ